jgi:nitrous oxidase accessory protein NosD
VLSFANQGIGMMLLFGLIGGIVGIAIGGAASSWNGPRVAYVLHRESNDWTSDLANNYWRDRGHPPFTKPSDSVPDKRMFDLERGD